MLHPMRHGRGIGAKRASDGLFLAALRHEPMVPRTQVFQQGSHVGKTACKNAHGGLDAGPNGAFDL
jgi:hypothetical protein